MKFSDIFKRQAFIISLAIVFVGLIILGVSYALFVVDASGSTNTIELGDLVATFNGSSTITTDLVPETDMEALEDPSRLFTYSLENTGSIDMAYNLVLDDLSSSDVYLEHKYIKVKIGTNDPVYLTELEKLDPAITGVESQYIVSSGVMDSGATLTNQSLRIWVSSYGDDGSHTPISVLNKKVNFQFVLKGEVDIPPIPYKDELLAGSDPVLDSKMVPVNIADTGVVTVADIYEDAWYNYAESRWANAVIVDSTFTTLDPGTTIPMESIEQMYVWIPRYEYKKSSIVNAQESIEINFVPISTVNTDIENNDVIVHPAFTFGGVEQAGLWVGKFEMGFNDGESETTTDVEYIIKPNVNSVHNTIVSTLFDKINNVMTIYSMDATTDVHMMKNTEWGAVAYLSQSQYGICEDDVTCSVKIENNNYYNNTTAWDIVTGCGGNDTVVTNNVTGIEICPASNRWETESGIKASTTHNITGIYDMAGGRNEYVMGNMQDSSGNFYSSSAGFTTAPDAKYYDSYEYGITYYDQAAYSRGLYGDATVELNPSGISMTNWNSDFAYFVDSSRSWFMRGGLSGSGSSAGVWYFHRSNGSAHVNYSTRSVGVAVQ